MKTEFYSKNRKKFMEKLETGSAVVFFSGEAPKKTADEKYAYSPNRNFLYLTGISEQNIALYMEKTEEGHSETLFIFEYDELKAKWVGETVSPQKAENISGIGDIKYLPEFNRFIHTKIKTNGKTVFYFDLEKDSPEGGFGQGGRFAQKMKLEYPEVTVKDAYPIVCGLRVLKTKEEADTIKKAIEITGAGIGRIMQNAKPGMYEYELEAEFNYELKKSGVKDFAFKTILASGKNATVLHYDSNDSKIGKNDLVLLDLGAAWNYYSADISRTFPISGKFTKRQRQLYDIVLKAHSKVIDLIAPGVHFKALNEAVIELYAVELQKIGLIKSPEEVKKYYFHGVSHHLGLDTHDVGPRDTYLAEGMILTVEPGLYIAEEGIGIRIEDDVMVTNSGSKVLSKDIIRTADEIEEFMAKR